MDASFRELSLKAEILWAINGLGFEQTTPIQASTIPLLMSSVDVIAQAQTSTGKTAAFTIPIMERVDPASAAVQALILTPTRELALQVAEWRYGS